MMMILSIMIPCILTLDFGFARANPDPHTPFLPFKHLHTNTAIDGPQQWFDGEVLSKDHCFHKCLKNYTDCEYVQYKDVTVGWTRTWLCKLYGVIADLSSYLVSTEGEMLATAVHQNLDCADWMKLGYHQSGAYFIYYNREKFKVWCQMIPGKARIIIQKRFDGSVDFYQNWEKYKNGFGDIGGEHWLGLENIHKLTKGRNMEIALWAHSFQNETQYAVYKNFYIEGEDSFYQLHAGVFVDGLNPDDWTTIPNGMKFSTFDSDQDISSPRNCAEFYPSGWWHENCLRINFNGVYRHSEILSTPAQGIVWNAWKGLTKGLKSTSMAIRRLD
ncbi:microfibril-associated glycoprotein 4-like [Clytia hemisphaerica]|uniref:microfibril-associated glycoprotein 4-like n=1 Tax=Clytia hemisphaerica TaxID=252671 RepID=UPI0034D68959